MYTRLEPARVVETVVRLESRIAERFPERGLRQVAAELRKVAEETRRRIRHNRRPILWIRATVVLVLMALVLVVAAVARQVHELGEVNSLLEFVQVFEPSLGSFFFLAAFLVGLFTLETKAKRSRSFESLHELRSLAHVVDMHQLHKDPDQLNPDYRPTRSSTAVDLTPFELGRYLDYCSELLSLLSKLAALHVQDLPDQEVIQAVDEVEELCTGLSRKIWQKIVLLESRARAADGPLSA